MLNNIFKRRETSVMHVGGCDCDVSERWHFELRAIVGVTSYPLTTDIHERCIVIESVIHEPIVRKVRSAMTMKTLARLHLTRWVELVEKQILSALLLCRE